MKRRTLIWIVVLVLVAGVGAYLWLERTRERTEEPRPLPRVSLNIVTWPGYGPAYLAQAKGFFADEGIEVSVDIQENTEARRSALLSGRVDLIGITLETVVLERAKGLPVTFIGVTDISAGGDGLVAKQEIASVDGLRGKTVAYPEGQPSHLYFLHLLEQAGVPFDSVNSLHTDDAGRAGELFAAGRVDAAVTWEPWLSTAEEAGKGKVLVRSDGVTPILIGGFEANSERLDGAQVDKLSRFLRAWYRALSYYEENAEEAVPIMAAGFGIPDEEFGEILSGLRFIDQEEAMTLFGNRASPGQLAEAVRYEADLWHRAGVIESTVGTEASINPSVLRKLLSLPPAK